MHSLLAEWNAKPRGVFLTRQEHNNGRHLIFTWFVHC